MRVGILGGSFDPVHYGHLLLAESCRESCRLERVWFLPAAVPPHKQHRTLTDARQRVEMLRLALGGNEAFGVSTLELDRGGVSYTVETLARWTSERPQDALFLLMGADSLVDFPTWREPERICELATPVVVRRAGSPEPSWDSLRPLVSSQRLAEIQRSAVEMPLVGFSSTELRHRAATQQSIRYRTPRAVEQYIKTHDLYRHPAGSGDAARQ